MTHSIQSSDRSVMHLMSLLPGLLLAGIVYAKDVGHTRTLKAIQIEKFSGGRIALHMDFSPGLLPRPRIFVTGHPPRIVVDLADTVSKVPRHTDIDIGATLGVTVVSAGGRTRVLIELLRSAAWKIRAKGNSLVLTVNNSVHVDAKSATVHLDPSKILPTARDGPTLTRIDFRRSAQGAGQVLIYFDGSGARANMRRKGNQVIVDLGHVKLPASQARRLEVLDFATPVQSIDTHATVSGARMDITFKGEVLTSSYQVGHRYVVDIAPKKAKGKGISGISAGRDNVYTGRRVTFNFQDIPVRSALQLVADVSGLNLVASDSINTNITLRLVNVPWDQALNVILRAKGLGQRRNGNVIWIAPQNQIANYEKHASSARLAAQSNDPLLISYIPISYGKASEIVRLLTNAEGETGGEKFPHGFLSARGSATVDHRTNTLLLKDTAEKTREIRKLIAKMDKPVRQVLIESRIVIATDSFARDLGVQWKTTTSKVTRAGKKINSLFKVNLPATAHTGALNFAILDSSYSLELELSAAQSEGRSELISSPRVITANQTQADIKQGQQIGYVTTQTNTKGQTSSSVQFKEAVLELKVTPTITADDRIYLDINVTKDALEKMVGMPSGQVPLISTRSVNTSALVDNGQTVVLGGIYEINRTDTVMKIPVLGDIPVLGGLFRKITKRKQKAEMLIFVTPKILSNNF